MKKQGILNSHIAKVLSDLGHTDKIVIADIGLPIPAGVPKIDLALTKGTPSFLSVLKVILEDMVVEKIYLAEEIKTHNAVTQQEVVSVASKIPIGYMSHESFKQLCAEAKVVIRTGEATPYANCILEAGVTF